MFLYLNFLARRINLKKTLLFIAIILLYYSAYKIYAFYVESSFYRMYFNGYGLRLGGNSSEDHCVLPNYDFMDPSIIPYIKRWPKIDCGRPQPYLTYLDPNGYIHRNASGIKETGIPEDDIKCVYQDIIRINNTDDGIKFGPMVVFEYPRLISSDYVVVRCFTHNTLVYETAHAWVRSPESKGLNSIPRNFMDRSGEDVSRKEKPSVLILTLDAMSRLNFMRQLPDTYSYLTETLNAVVLKGLVKSGDNTYPNMMPMLAGMGAYKYLYDDDLTHGEKLRVPIWGGENARHENFDDVPFVWKNFSDAGFITFFAEDAPIYTIFNYLAKGFLFPPTDYYMRPFWLFMDGLKEFRSSDHRCYGNKPKHTYLFDHMEEFVTKMSNHSYFAFCFLTELTHNEINSAQILDDELEALLKRMHRSGSLDNTIMFVMGDHGNRFDDIRATVIGRVEERMPFFSIYLPESIRESQTHLMTGLQGNTDNLLSWFDIHELLMDIAMDNLDEVSKVKRWGAIGLSPFRYIPKNRTCLEIGIPRTYCVCGIENEISPKHWHSIEAAKTLTEHVNELIKSAGVGEVCAELRAIKVLSAQLLVPVSPVVSSFDVILETRITVETAPGGALLEGIVQRNAWSKSGGHVIGEVNRINRYGNQSHCVNSLVMKLYCFCNDIVIT